MGLCHIFLLWTDVLADTGVGPAGKPGCSAGGTQEKTHSQVLESPEGISTVTSLCSFADWVCGSFFLIDWVFQFGSSGVWNACVSVTELRKQGRSSARTSLCLVLPSSSSPNLPI